jgi:hypothetical protein
MVRSRVRERYFTVTVVDHGPKTSLKPSNEQDDTLAQIAEQVAGNLY